MNSFTVLGIDPAGAAVGPLSAVELADGRGLEASDAGQAVAVLDASYATSAELAVGDTIDVGGTEFEVVGTVTSTSADAATASNVYIPLDLAQSIAGLDGQVSDLYVQATSSDQIAAVQADIEEALPDATVSTQADLAASVSGSLATASSLIANLGLWLSVAVLVAAFLIAILFTIQGVTRRTREFGTLKAIGWSNRRVVGQVAGESLVQGLIGGAAGLVLGLVGHLGDQPRRADPRRQRHDRHAGRRTRDGRTGRRRRGDRLRAVRRSARGCRGRHHRGGAQRTRDDLGRRDRDRARRPRRPPRRCDRRLARLAPPPRRGAPQRRLSPRPPTPTSRTHVQERTTMYTLENVSKTYTQSKRQVTALADVTLSIPSGQLVAIQGPTGGGKSTLLQMLGALDRPTSGRISLGEAELSHLPDRKLGGIRAKEIGFVFQGFNLIPTLTAQENVETALAPLGVPAEERRRRALDALASVGLADRAGHVPGELSGGQQQRVAIARALVKEPDVLLADEPTGNLDEETRDEIMDLLEGLWRDRGLTLVVVTHDSAVAKRAERRLHIKHGTVTERS